MASRLSIERFDNHNGHCIYSMIYNKNQNHVAERLCKYNTAQKIYRLTGWMKNTA